MKPATHRKETVHNKSAKSASAAALPEGIVHYVWEDGGLVRVSAAANAMWCKCGDHPSIGIWSVNIPEGVTSGDCCQASATPELSTGGAYVLLRSSAGLFGLLCLSMDHTKALIIKLERGLHLLKQAGLDTHFVEWLKVSIAGQPTETYLQDTLETIDVRAEFGWPAIGLYLQTRGKGGHEITCCFSPLNGYALLHDLRASVCVAESRR